MTRVAFQQIDRQGFEAIERRRAVTHQVAAGGYQFGEAVLQI